MTSAWRTRLGLAVGVLLITCAFFPWAVFSEEIFVSRDILRVYYPLRQYLAERLLHGEYPDWYPYDGLGQPFVGMVISGAFHPANLLFLALPPGVAMKLNILACYPVAVAGAYAFARLWKVERDAALLGGMAYGFSGYLVSLSNNLLYLMAAATFPWALWAAERFFRAPTARRLAGAAVLLVLILLAGDSQSFAVCSGLSVLWALVRPGAPTAWRRLLAPLVLLATTALLGLVQLVPVRNVLHDAQPGANPLEVAQFYSLHPLRLAELALGPLFAEHEPGSVTVERVANGLLGAGRGSLWSESIHIGALALLLGLGAAWVYRRHAWTWAGLAVGAVLGLLALGRFGFLYARVFEWVPPWRPFRYPEKLVPYVLWLLTLGAAFGLQRVREDEATRRAFGRVALGGAGLALLLAAVEQMGGLYSRHLLPALWSPPVPAPVPGWLGPNLVSGALACAVTLALAGLVLLRVRSATWRSGLLCGLQLASLLFANAGLSHGSIPTVLEEPTPFARTVRERLATHPIASDSRVHSAVTALRQRDDEGLSRMDWQTLTVLTSLLPETPTLFGLDEASAYLPATSVRFGPLDEPLEPWLGRLGGLYGVRFEVLSAPTYSRMGGRASAVLQENADLGLVLLENPTALPRAYLARPRCVVDADQALALLLSRAFRPGRDAAVECGEADATVRALEAQGPVGEGPVRMRRPSPEHVEVEASGPGLLVLNEAYYSGWHATVDDVPTAILPTNIAVKGVVIPPGPHRIVFHYETPGARAAAGLSLLTLLALLVAALLARPARQESLAPRV